MRVFFILFLFFSSFLLRAQSAAEVYIASFDSLAIEVSRNYGIPASLVLGIALHETGAGMSKICQINHNHFGVRGRVKSTKTKSGYKMAYIKFDTDVDSYLFFGEMISHKKYYTGLKGNMNHMKWLRAMKAAKYATSSSWISLVDKMIRRYDLTCYDTTNPWLVLPIAETEDTLNYQTK